MSRFITDSLFAMLVKVDHIIFKHNAYSAIINENEQTAAGLTDHHNCRMGKRYYDGEGKDKFSHTKAYRELEKYHAAVHDILLKTVPCAIEKNCLEPSNTDKLVSNIIEMEKNSDKLFEMLDEMILEANKNIK